MDKLKTYLLNTLPFLESGFIDIFLDTISGRLISWKGEEVGIDDRNGNYFYIREVSSENYRIKSNEAPKMLTATQNYKLVLVAQKKEMEEVKTCVINALSYFDGVILSSTNNNIGEIIKSEYPAKSSTEILEIMKKINFGTVISANFTFTRDIYVNNCKCEIPEEC